MKSKLILFLLLNATLQGIFAEETVVKGVNYDPVHSFEFAKAVGLDDKQGMVDAINADLDKLAELQNNGFPNIRYLKTFFTTYSSLGNTPGRERVSVNIADIVNKWNLRHPHNALRLALGVYEFRVKTDLCATDDICKQWTQAQVDAAIKSANTYPKLVDKIIVGNEDLDDSPSGLIMQERLIDDINMIKRHLINKSILVGTAQTSATVDKMFHTQAYANVKNTADFIGANVYPYWGGVSYGKAPYTNSPAKQNLESYWSDMDHVKNNYQVIETEEGWPSDGRRVWDAVPLPDCARDYLYYWYHRYYWNSPNPNVVSTSYYFALFDKTPGQGTESHWGIFSADRNASLLGSPVNPNDYSKPFSDGHILVKFDNQVRSVSGIARVVSLNACTDDWNSDTKSQGTCYPIYGYAHTGDVLNSINSNEFMIDATGKTYSSLLVTFYDDQNQSLRLCYINKASLLKMKNQSQVTLTWKTADGAVPC